MKPYILIKGSDKNIEEFETKVANALEAGYEFSSELVTKVANNNDSEIVFIQPMTLEEDFDLEDDEELEDAYLEEEI